MTIPSFFIIGAPKCGTTALSLYLSEHPDVLFSNPKEPRYFHTDFGERHRATLSQEEYDACFVWNGDIPPKTIGEGTVWYLYSRDAVPKILTLNPKAKFIVMARNPIDLAYSLHSQFLYGGYENIEDFSEAWHAQDKRRRGENLPPLCADRKLLLYGDVAALGTQIERLLARARRDRVHLVLFDDFARDVRAVYNDVLAFLQLDPDDRTAFPQINVNKVVTWRRTARALHFLSAIKQRLRVRRSFGVWCSLAPYLTRPEPRVPMDPDLRAELQAHFRPEIEKLSRLFDRDLSEWLQ